MSDWKRKKYRTLRHLPGKIGRRYTEKYELHGTSWRFLDALDFTAGMVSIDLGANIGEYSQLLARRAQKVYAFEPDPWALEQLRKNTAHLDNVEIVEAAAGTCEGSVNLYRHPEFADDPIMNSQSSSVVSNKYNISHEDSFEVPQVDVLKFLRDLDQNIGVLKVDIEGAEVDLFEKLFDDADLLSRIKYIFAETHETKIPGHEPRVAALKARAEKIKSPVIDLTWH
ncbi:FkbM family methyltransferase [uncultured Roseobacter sp.]|uniref:FkbM family methyltransferase n=1 Tax=uncultured Roseobacter sp. TaxID=114847 RepID=UPI002638BF04|nr:FkbM family methyltransferase [uncultured Roseobacter sp.]